MVVSEGAINNIMGGMENTAGVRLHSHRHKLKQRFEILRKLGQGTYGKVQLAVNKETGQEVAIKTIKKAKIETEQDLIRIRREIQIMSSVQHPQIIHIYEVFENREKMVLVMEYAAGGELYDYLSERKVLPEEEARRVFRHVASAVYYCHKHKICHRDLKLENILLDLDGNAKIADFGLSNVFDDKHRLDTFCGSPLYASPEIVKGIPYTGPEVDCWSLGVLLYTLVYGAMPFDGSNFKRLVKQITAGDYYEPKKPSTASELIRHMLTVSATKRATVEDICSHWWVNEGYMESCLEVAETLANQTPVRLDLLLSLAPKHINSEHMLIQPDDDDISLRSPPVSQAMPRPPPQLQLPPPPPPEAPPGTPARSLSMTALGSVVFDFDAILAKKRAEKDEERKRKTEDIISKENKKKKEIADISTKVSNKKSDNTTEATEGSSVMRRPPKPTDGDNVDRKKSVKKRESVVDGDISDRSEKSERRKSTIKKREVNADGSVSDSSEKTERRKSLKKREPSAERDVSGKSVKKREPSTESDTSLRSVKKKEPSVERDIVKSIKKREPSVDRPVGSRKVEKKTVIKMEDSPHNQTKIDACVEENYDKNETILNDDLKAKSYVDHSTICSEIHNGIGSSNHINVIAREISESQPVLSSIEETSRVNNIINKKDKDEESERVQPMDVDNSANNLNVVKNSESIHSMTSLTSNDVTLKASGSSLSRESPLKSEVASICNLKDSTIEISISKDSSINEFNSAPLIKVPSTKMTFNETNNLEKGTVYQPKQCSNSNSVTDKILQETADKMKLVEESHIPFIVETHSDDLEDHKEESLAENELPTSESSKDMANESTSSKDSSQHSSVFSTPVRSRAGSESSNESRPSRTDSAKRQSKIFKAAAMWEAQNVPEKPVTTLEKPKPKPLRQGGLSDLAKKFEEKSMTDRKTKILPSVKRPPN